MKIKLIHFLILSLFAISVFVSCASPDESSKIPADTQSPAATVEATEAQTEAPTEAEIKTETAGETQALTEPQTQTVTEPHTETPAEEITETEPLTEEETEENTESVTETETEAQTEILCENDEYTITLVNDQCYINFADGNDLTPEDRYDNWPLGSFSFSSVQELKESFLSNQLTDEQKAIMRNAFAEDVYGIKLCNLTKLYVPTLPEDVSQKSVTVLGTNYYFKLDSDLITGYFQILTLPDYEFQNNRDFRDYDDKNADITRQENGTFDGAGCEIVEYTYSSGVSYRDIYLTLSNGDDVTEIEISYCVDNPNPQGTIAVSETMPWRVLIFGKNGDQHFNAYIEDFKAPPTVEWLTSFGITPYVENADQVMS